MFVSGKTRDKNRPPIRRPWTGPGRRVPFVRAGCCVADGRQRLGAKPGRRIGGGGRQRHAGADRRLRRVSAYWTEVGRGAVPGSLRMRASGRFRLLDQTLIEATVPQRRQALGWGLTVLAASACCNRFRGDGPALGSEELQHLLLVLQEVAECRFGKNAVEGLLDSRPEQAH